MCAVPRLKSNFSRHNLSSKRVQVISKIKLVGLPTADPMSNQSTHRFLRDLRLSGSYEESSFSWLGKYLKSLVLNELFISTNKSDLDGN